MPILNWIAKEKIENHVRMCLFGCLKKIKSCRLEKKAKIPLLAGPRD
jgi:hypothetical protein